MIIIKVGYNPKISHKAMQTIRNDVTYSMTSHDGSTEQYAIDFCIETLKTYGSKYKEDIKYLEESTVDFIEF